MLTCLARTPLIVLLLVYGIVSLLVPDFATGNHAIMIAFFVSGLLSLDGLLTAEQLRRQRKAHAQRRARYYDADFLAEASAMANKQYQYNQHRPHDNRLN
jgi:hypothetical protein